VRPLAIVWPDGGAIRFKLSVASLALEFNPSSACLGLGNVELKPDAESFSSLPISSISPGLPAGGAEGVGETDCSDGAT
jgi:hypothetical protein